MNRENKNQNQNQDNDYFFFHYDNEEEKNSLEGEISDLGKDEVENEIFLKGNLSEKQEGPIAPTKEAEETYEDPGHDKEKKVQGIESISQILEEYPFSLKKEDPQNNPLKEGQDQEDLSADPETFSFNKNKILLIKKLLQNIQENNEKLLQLFKGLGEEDEVVFSKKKVGTEEGEKSEEAGTIIEGVFDGESMIGPDGKKYPVPTNYASKSKLVEGDILKLTVSDRGDFIYKQIHPIERVRVVGELKKGSDGNYYVVKNDKKWLILSASVTYFKGETGDETVILVPAEGHSKFAAVENIIKK